MTAPTLARVTSFTRELPWRTSETVDFDTPAARATSTTVTFACFKPILPGERFLAPISESNNWNVPNCQALKNPDAAVFTKSARQVHGHRNAKIVHNSTFQTIYYT
ncbi:protein of unknown function [Aminobacter niigataensis]|nr:protein of unknown function [Aminobacter niigataensis]